MIQNKMQLDIVEGITSDKDITNKKYVDDAIAEATAVTVEDYDGGSPPSGRPRGTLLLTTGNVLYIYI